MHTTPLPRTKKTMNGQLSRRWASSTLALIYKGIIFLVLSGCSPFLEVGAGYNFESGDYGFDERCVLGYYGAGLEGDVWSLGYQHTSCFDERPELVTNQVILKRKFGGKDD